MSTNLTGRCICGQVSWQAPGPVLWAGHCHCESCRRSTSSPFTSFFGVKRNTIKWRGELAVSHTSNGKVARKFCPHCGSQMTCEVESWPDEAHLYAATLEDPSQFTPRAHFHFAEKLPWVRIDDELPKFPGSADTPKPAIE